MLFLLSLLLLLLIRFSKQLTDEGCGMLARRVMVQNAKFYERFPNDVAVVHDIVKYLAASRS